jgi:hypothetical protein
VVEAEQEGHRLWHEADSGRRATSGGTCEGNMAINTGRTRLQGRQTPWSSLGGAAAYRDVQPGDGTCGGGEHVLAGEELERGRCGRATTGMGSLEQETRQRTDAQARGERSRRKNRARAAAALQGKTRGGTRPRVAGRLVLKGGGLQGSTSHQS